MFPFSQLLALWTYPVINPVWFNIPVPYFGPLPIRWYALAYIAGLIGGLLYARFLVQRPQLWGAVKRPDVLALDDLLVYAALGTIIGGRLGILFFTRDYYIAHPLDIFKVWEGGMSFHGGLIGVVVGIWFFARKYQLSFLSVADICAVVVPIGIFFGRLANFIRPEMWGRPTDVSWAMIFPSVDDLPRHPSQLYEAGLEGLLLLVILALLVARGGLKKPGLAMGLFGVCYGIARIFSEFFRQPDSSEDLANGLTMGMVLSLPLIIIGAGFMIKAMRKTKIIEDTH